MPQILNASDKLQVNTLFLQPTRWCALDCKGCYVKEHFSDGPTPESSRHTEWNEQLKLFNYYYQNNMANQITISIDKLPSEYVRHEHMASLYTGILLSTSSTIGPDIRPNVHFTYHDLATLEDYHTHFAKSYLKSIDVISLSNIATKDLPSIKNHLVNYAHINYNHLIPSNVTTLNIDNYVEKMTRIGEIVDSIYLVMFKRPIGYTEKQPVAIGDTQRMQADISYINTMLGRLPKHVRNKINVDGCLEDTIRFQRTGYGCSANVSRIQVWPDGSVSGCPYAFRGHTPPGSKLADILENIKQARESYDFDRCHLPKIYNNLSRRS